MERNREQYWIRRSKITASETMLRRDDKKLKYMGRTGSGTISRKYTSKITLIVWSLR